MRDYGRRRRWLWLGLAAGAAGCHEVGGSDGAGPEGAPARGFSPDSVSITGAGLNAGGAGPADWVPSDPCFGESAVAYYQFYSFRDGVAYPTMRDRVQPGDRVAVEFKPTAGCGGKFSLVTYAADGPAGGDLTRQRVYAAQTVDAPDGPVDSYAIGFDTDLRAPPCAFQVDFVRGEPIEQFDPANGVAYGVQGRLIDWDQSEPGTASCLRRYEFTFTRPNDYLFVIDNSVSFGPLANELRQAYDALTPADFPVDARVGILSSLPGDDDAYGNPLEPRRHHPEVNAYPGIDLEPGFLKPVSRADYDAYLAQPFLPPEYRAKYAPLAPCAGPFFKPKEVTGPGGASCFMAGSVFAHHATEVETPLVAYYQTLTRAVNFSIPTLFRDEASVHLVVLSDTQEPGYVGSELVSHDGRNPERLESLTLFGDLYETMVPDTFDFSAIYPTAPHHSAYAGTGCPVEPYGDYQLPPSPYPAVKQRVGGVVRDICSERGNYTAALRAIVGHEKRARYRPNLPPDVAQIVSVMVNKEDWDDKSEWELYGGLYLYDLSSRKTNHIVIDYLSVASP